MKTKVRQSPPNGGKVLDPLAAFTAEVEQESPRSFLLEGLLPNEPGSYGMLCGRAGLGKSILSLNLAFAIATGSPWMRFNTQKARVGYWTCEGSKRALLDRINVIRQRYPDPGDNLHLAVMPIPRLPGGERKMAQAIRDCQLVLLDCLKYAVRGDYTRPQDATLFIRSLMNVGHATGACFLLLHHLRKRNFAVLIDPEDLSDEVKGAGDFLEAANVVILVERERQGHRPGGGFAPVDPDMRQLHFVKTRDAPAAIPPLRLRFCRRTLSFEVEP